MCWCILRKWDFRNLWVAAFFLLTLIPLRRLICSQMSQISVSTKVWLLQLLKKSTSEISPVPNKTAPVWKKYGKSRHQEKPFPTIWLEVQLSFSRFMIWKRDKKGCYSSTALSGTHALFAHCMCSRNMYRNQRLQNPCVLTIRSGNSPCVLIVQKSRFPSMTRKNSHKQPVATHAIAPFKTLHRMVKCLERKIPRLFICSLLLMAMSRHLKSVG